MSYTILPIETTITYPNRQKAPYASSIIPMIAQPINTMSIPPKKQAVPLILWDWKKNLKVLSNPIMKKMPATKRIWREGREEGRERGGGGGENWCINLWTTHLSAWITVQVLTFPIANSPLSNIRITPSVRKASPKVTRPNPISEIRDQKFNSTPVYILSLFSLTLHVCQADR